MSITAGDLYASARARTGLNFADGRLDDNNIVGVNTAINAGLTDLVAAHDWDWLYDENIIGIVPSVESYRTPTNFMRALWLANDNNEELSLRQRRDAIRFSSGTGTPRYFSILNGQIYLSPTPSQAAVYRIGYYVQFERIDALTVAALDDIDLEIPDMFVSLATLYIAKNIAMMFKDYDAYRLLTEEIRAEMKRVADNTRRSLGPVAPQTRHDGY